MTTTPARDALYDALTTGTQHAQIRQHLIDAAFAEDHAAQAAEVRAATLTDAADEAERSASGLVEQIALGQFANKLRRMAAAARPDTTPAPEPCPPGCVACATDESHDPARPDNTGA